VLKELDGFRVARFVHVSRDMNSVAHVLAKEAAMHKLDNCWLEEVPAFISSIVFREKPCP
jgi:hypothetical protein